MDVVNVGGGVDEVLVALTGEGGVWWRAHLAFGGSGCRLQSCSHHVFEGRRVKSEARRARVLLLLQLQLRGRGLYVAARQL